MNSTAISSSLRAIHRHIEQVNQAAVRISRGGDAANLVEAQRDMMVGRHGFTANLNTLRTYLHMHQSTIDRIA